MNLYEWGFEVVLTQRRQRFWRMRDVDRAVLDAGPVKGFDYLVQAGPDQAWLVEIKGRSFPTSTGGLWENWVTQDDLASLLQWQQHFGACAAGLLVFAYRCTNDAVMPGRPWTPLRVDATRFGFVAVEVQRYMQAAKLRSKKWRTFSLPRASFLKLVRPLEAFLTPCEHLSRAGA